MFDFEKLDVYQKAKAFNKEVLMLMKNTKPIDIVTKNQLRRASLSIVLNIAEGTGRFNKADKRHFYIMSRGSAFECVAIFDVLKDETILNEEEFTQFYGKADELSRMLFRMIGNLSSN
ncbi:MAG: ribosomal protein [Fluviicola sp.]|jgi:four helix bundle protein|uniref:four helix bundle protein n=1 Tax=Fluviicola sp. TaxID=1917219 RepID=UPI002616AE8E|nr:four helix bundle protein [Fluviicola sp.]MDF3028995.1 ribosomal protein [Fluviicola sp.]